MSEATEKRDLQALAERERPIRFAMIGGGEGAFIGAVHRSAMALDRSGELVAGVFSRDATNSQRSGARLGLEAARVHASTAALWADEAARPAKERIEAVAIVTPNHLHLAQAKEALSAGVHVFCEKPLGTSVAETREVLSAWTGAGEPVFGVAHAYAAMPMVEQARELVAEGRIGPLRKIHVEYLQGWLSDPIEREGQKQAAWRNDPQLAGPAGALGDIGTHALHLSEHVSGLRVERLLARRQSVVPGRPLDDDAQLWLEFGGGATGSLMVSQVCHGMENGLSLRIFGERGSLHWHQEEPDSLQFSDESGLKQTLRRAGPLASPGALALTRTPSGHPEGYLEGFANLYRAFQARIRTPEEASLPLPGFADGVRGLRFLEAAIASDEAGEWRPLPA